MKKHYVYELYCDKDETVYVGKTNSLDCRLKRHKHNARCGNTTIKNSWMKSRGIDNIKIRVIAGPFDSSDVAFDEEIRIIAKHRLSGVKLVNDPRTVGGENPPNHTGVKRSLETRKRMSISQKEAWKRPEVRENNRKGHTGVKKSQEHIENIRKAMTGRKCTENARRNMSIAQKNSPLRPAVIEKMRIANRKPVLCLTNNKEYDSITSAMEELKISNSRIRACCNDGKERKSMRFEWVKK